MLKVLDVFPIGTKLSVTLNGACENIKNGTKLIDSHGNIIIVDSVAMTRNDEPSDISKSTTILVNKCDISEGEELSIA
ncbi:MAG: hypothetical protein K5979_07735 [Ruminococcus sp.]|nr:hypothetical protein [Ruminococcus sp.]